jgi:putative transcriptional regulator
MKSRRRKSVASQIIEGLTEFAEALERGEPLDSRFTVRTVELPPEPTHYTPKQIRATRDRLSASQAVFASLVGVSTTLVQHWEQGFRRPSRMACRLLDEINHDPKRWARMIGARKTA